MRNKRPLFILVFAATLAAAFTALAFLGSPDTPFEKSPPLEKTAEDSHDLSKGVTLTSPTSRTPDESAEEWPKPKTWPEPESPSGKHFAELSGGLQGIIRGPDEVPVPGAHVSAALESSEGEFHRLGPTFQTRADGKFSFSLPPESNRRLHLLVRSTCFPPMTRELDLTPQRDLTPQSEIGPSEEASREDDRLPSRAEIHLDLPRGLTLEGIVVDERGNPIPESLVFAEPTLPFVEWEPLDSVDRRTSEGRENGSFRLSGLASGKWKLGVLAAGYARFSETLDLLHAPQKPIEIVLFSAETLSGKVTTTEGVPIRGAEVSLRNEMIPTDVFSERAVTSAKGIFTFASLSPGKYEIFAKAASRAPRRLKVQIPMETPFTIELQNPATLKGSFISDGEEYTLELYLAEGRFVTSEVFSDDPFQFSDLPSGEYDLRARLDGMPAQTVVRTALLPGEQVDLGEIYLRAGPSLLGTLVGRDTGTPVPATCSLFRLRPEPGRKERKKTRVAKVEVQNGRFLFRSVEPGTYKIAIRPRAGSGARTETDEFSVVGDRDVDLGTIPINRASLVRVSLNDPEGASVVGAAATLASTNYLQTGRVLAPGRFEFAGVPEGPVRIHVSYKGAAFTLPKRVAAPETSIELVLPPKSFTSWKGELRRHGLPLFGVYVRAHGVDGTWSSSSAESDRQGGFALEGIGGGLAFLNLHNVPGADGPVRFPIASPLPERIDVSEGSISVATEPPLPNATLVFSLIEWKGRTAKEMGRLGEDYATLETGAFGRATLSRAVAGRYKVELFAPPGSESPDPIARGTVVLGPDEKGNVVLRGPSNDRRRR